MKTNETLGQKQRRFGRMVAALLNKALEMGYEYTFGDAYRDARVHGEFGTKASYSAAKSVHKVRLAVDFNLFKGGIYRTETSAYTELGEYWESLHPLNRWGGRWQDGNHFSMEYQGAK